MTISVRALHPLFVGEISGVDLRTPVDQETFREIDRVLERYAVLVFRSQPLTAEQQIAFSRLFGPLETSIGSIRKDRKSRLGNKLLADISNLDENNDIRSRSDRWRMMQLVHQLCHTDSYFKRVPPTVPLLSAYSLPLSGGETEFADLRAL
jgi:alpha-ketoglutarate-dependent 2,4-dichlorophenoxyacetate dioxygenase